MMVDLTAGTNRLIGRDRELGALDAFLGAVAQGGSTLVLVGEPGVGKTALLHAAAEMATTNGVRVIHCGGMEYESDISFAGLHQLVDPLSDDLRHLPRTSRGVLEVALGIGSGPPPDRLAVLSAALMLFRQAASSSPLLIVVDDLHWLDRASGAVVGFVGRRLRGGRVGLLGAIRPGVGGFFERTGLPEFSIAPLADAQAMELLTRRFVHLPTRLLRRVVEEAEGNPLALLEFAASVSGQGDSDDTTVIAGSSRQLRTLYQSRIGRLPEPTRRLLLLAALNGSGDLGVLAAASGPGRLEELEPAERDHLVVVDDRIGELRFRHPILKSVVVERSTHAERRAAHQRLAELFAEQPERRGHHLAEAADAPDEEVAAAIEEAARRTLERGDVAGAISKLLRAADLSPNRADRSRRLADTAFTGARLAGDLDRASALLRDAQQRDPTLGETLHAAVATAYVLLNGDGNTDTAAHLLVAAIDAALAEADPDRDGLAEGLYMLALVCHYAGRPEYWLSFHDAMGRLPPGAAPQARLLADTFADPVAASDRALAELDREISKLRDVDDAVVIMRCSIAGFYTDRLMACREPLERVVQDGREGGAVRSAMTALAMLAFGELHAGRWDDARAAGGGVQRSV